MSDLQIIQSTVAAAARRRRLERAWRGAWLGLLGTAALWLAALGAWKTLPLPLWALAAAGAAGAAAPLAGALVGLLRKVSLAETARWIDARHRLKERLSTALEIGPADTEWARLLARDAAAHARSVDLRGLVPLRLPRHALWAVLLLAVGAGLGFVPEYRSARHLQKKAEAAHIREAGKQLSELARRRLEQKPPALEDTRKALASIEEMGRQLERSPLTRSEALRDLTSLAEKLGKQVQDLARDPALKPLERAARESGAAGGQTAEALQKQIEDLKRSLGNDKATPDALEKLKASLDRAQKAAAALANRSDAAAQAGREQLSQDLSSLAQQAREMGHPFESLESAIAGLEKNQIGQVLRDLDAAALDMDKLRDTARALSQLQQQAAQLGKDLPEQLRLGQAEAARSTLQKMIAAMKSAGLTRPDLQKLLDEVSRSIDPAGEYGQVADHLKEALRQMRDADQSGSADSKSRAAESLARAAKDLEKLAQEMGDMQALASALDALDRAQQSIATGQGWGQCKRPGSGQCSNCGGWGCAACQGQGWGHGAGLGASGVGTWADEKEGWTYYPDKIPQTPVDNSNVKRPDMDARGISDRGPGELSDALKPTKVKSKMAPGGPMPSITLKGVSIKGQSNVRFEEAAATAQSEAQSALNQDQVPRVYQNAVKDYFDDLKK